jgi:hypothetical protein
MPQTNVHDQVLQAYTLHLAMRNTLLPPHELDTFEMITRLQADVSKAQEHLIFQSMYQDPQVWVSSPCMGICQKSCSS